MKSCLPLLLLPGALAFDFPFKLPSLFSSSPTTAQPDHLTPSASPRIAIVGAGPGGTSAAFWISKAKARFGLDLEVDVYESNSYIGGRVAVVHPYDNTSLPELELGASTFVEINKNLWRASDEFNLTRRVLDEGNYDTAIWDGENILLSYSGSWRDTAKMLWRYGYSSPKRTESFVHSAMNQLMSVYTLETPKWDNIPYLAKLLGWTEALNKTSSGYLLSQGVSEKYIFEVVEAATRVNFGQNADYIHAIEGAASMAATGASGIVGGNFQIFENFLNRSGANVHLNTPVNSITPKQSKSRLWTVKSKRGSVDYKAVILAAPLHSSDIIVPHLISDQVPEQTYIHLHVTLLSTTSAMPNPDYFGLLPSSSVPRVILTTYQGAREGEVKPEFNSLTYQGLVREGEWAVKIVSENELADEWLNKMFLNQVGWVHRKEWKAYPKFPPFPPFPPVKLNDGFYYVNSFEPLISTMEAETVSSRNIVDLLLSEEFNSGICGEGISAVEDDQQLPQQVLLNTSKENFVYGWDC